MRTQTVGMLLVLSCGIMFACSCAKHELVGKDEPIAPAAAAAKPPLKTEQVESQPVTQVSEKEITAQEADKSAAEFNHLQAALEKIYFDFDAYKLSDQARATLAKNAELLKKAPAARVSIAGNCDERGSDEYNLALGEQRAKAAQQYLVTMGISANNLSMISYGKEKPADRGHDEAAWAKNRRDEFVVVTN